MCYDFKIYFLKDRLKLKFGKMNLIFFENFVGWWNDYIISLGRIFFYFVLGYCLELIF